MLTLTSATRLPHSYTPPARLQLNSGAPYPPYPFNPSPLPSPLSCLPAGAVPAGRRLHAVLRHPPQPVQAGRDRGLHRDR